jgi:HK97 family phage prohead protease
MTESINISIKSADLFIEQSLKTVDVIKGHGIRAVIGKLKADPSYGTKVEKYIFEKNRWDDESAQKWVNEHKSTEDSISMTEALAGSNQIINLSDEGSKKMERIQKMYACENKDFDDNEKSFIATASTEDVDRDGDVLALAGWKLKNFKRNPVVLWMHDANIMPIAKADSVWIEDGKLKFKPVFAPKDVNPFAEQVYNAYRKGFLTSFSVRFDPIEWEDMPQESGKFTRGRKYKSHELLEISAVNIPANPEATKSGEMLDFIIKSYAYENKLDGNIDIQGVYANADKELKSKIEKLFELRELKEKNIETQKILEVEKFVDLEIERLTKELQSEKESEKIKLLNQEIKSIQIGITNLLK